MTNLHDSYTELFVLPDDGPPHFECSHCTADVSDRPCPDHAPLADVAGLRLIPCDAEPRHWTWVHNRDDYGVPCPWCLLADQAERDAEARQCRHSRWRRTRVFQWLTGQAYALGIISGSATSWGDGHNGCTTWMGWRGQRPYILGAARETWRCWLKGRHRRGAEIGVFGFCGKCLPWPCCGSQGYNHAAGCAENEESAR